MDYFPKNFFSALVGFAYATTVALSAEKFDATPTALDNPLLQKMYACTNLDITASEFKEFELKKKIIYLGLYSIDFKINGLSQPSVLNYISFLRILLPHLKTDIKVYDDLKERYGNTKKNRAVIDVVRILLKPSEKKTFTEVEEESFRADEYQRRGFSEVDPAQKVELYKNALFIWERVHRDTDFNNDPFFQTLHYRAISKRFDLKRLIRVAEKKAQML